MIITPVQAPFSGLHDSHRKECSKRKRYEFRELYLTFGELDTVWITCRSFAAVPIASFAII